MNKVLEYAKGPDGHIVSPCPFGMKFHPDFYSMGIGPNSQIMIGSVICTGFCPHCQGYNSKKKLILCSFNTATDKPMEVMPKRGMTPYSQKYAGGDKPDREDGWMTV